MDNWKNFLNNESKKAYFIKLQKFIERERESKTIFPPKEDVFNAFLQCHFSQLKIVILGQDPYHGINQAHGLSFSVKKGNKHPPSLRNIFVELNSDLNITKPIEGDLTSWANQGVMLLNATLTVEEGKAGSHQQQGWEEFTDNTIKYISDNKEHVVFMLWGRYARNKKNLIDTNKHLILEAAHPSPLSAYNGFFGSNHFSRANNYLVSNKLPPIYWNSIHLKIIDLHLFLQLSDRKIHEYFIGPTPLLCPTDTVWGLHTHYRNCESIDIIKKLKHRDDTKQFIVLTDNLNKIENLDIDEKSLKFIEEASLLGAVTFKLNCKDNSTITVRIPQQEWLKNLLHKLDFPIISTSANISNNPIPKSKKELFSLFSHSVNICNDDNDNLETVASTILDLTLKNSIRVIREGKVDFLTLEQLWKSL